MKSALKLGTRGSVLAYSSQWVADQLSAATGCSVTLQIIETKGDRIQDKPPRQVGGKGLFTKEVEEALLNGDVDFAVHSMKDMPTEMPDGLVFGCIPVREDARDVLVGMQVEELKETVIVGTGSARRHSLLNELVSGLDIRGIRGNVDTRIAKQRNGEYDVVVLAAAGLKRLGREHEIDAYLPIAQMIPAVGQGALAVQCRRNDEKMLDLLQQIHCANTAVCVGVERVFLTEMGGGCSVPVACHVSYKGSQLEVRAAYLTSAGSLLRAYRCVDLEDARATAMEFAQTFNRANASS